MIRRDRSQQAGFGEYPPKDLKLNSNEVHVWRALYSNFNPNLTNMIQLLSKDEQKRADKYHLDRDRYNFILRNGLLRQILSRYLRINAEQLVLQKNNYGKPFLKTCPGEDSILFSSTHSIGLVLYAFSQNLEVGIDVERIHPFPDMNGIVHRFFSSPERSEYDLLPPEKRSYAFFRGWTCKEALLKAIGKGLSDGLDAFCLTLDPEKRANIHDMDSQSIKASDWSLEVFEPIPNYVSAVAIASTDKRYALRFFKWN